MGEFNTDDHYIYYCGQEYLRSNGVAIMVIKFSRQVYWSGLPFPTPGDFPNPGIEPVSLKSPTLVGGFFITEPPEQPSENEC